MIEEIKARQTNQEQSTKVGSSQDGAGVVLRDADSMLSEGKHLPLLKDKQKQTLR